MDPQKNPTLERMLDYGNLPGLVQSLRHPSDPHLRAQAAETLARTNDLSVSEWLVKSYFHDPDPGVRAASLRALQDLLGAQSELAIQAERQSGPDEAAWLLPPRPGARASETVDPDPEPEEDEPADLPDWGLSVSERDTVRGLIGILHGNSSREVRLQAVRVLATYADLTATRALAHLALSDHDPQVKAEAMRVLEETFQSGLDDILTNLREEEGMDDDFEEDAEDPDLEESLSAQIPLDSPWQTPPVPSAIHEERTPAWVWVLLAVLILGALWFFFLR
jgi:hypothetical protein